MSDIRRGLMATANSGGEGTIECGTFTVASDISVTNDGTTIDVGYHGEPDVLIVWIDADDYKAIETPSNNRWYSLALIKNDPLIISAFPPRRFSASETVQRTFASADYIISAAIYVQACSAETNGYAVLDRVYYSKNMDKNKINNDGTITIARPTTAGSVFLAGTYHYVAITGMGIGLV